MSESRESGRKKYRRLNHEHNSFFVLLRITQLSFSGLGAGSERVAASVEYTAACLPSIP